MADVGCICWASITSQRTVSLMIFLPCSFQDLGGVEEPSGRVLGLPCCLPCSRKFSEQAESLPLPQRTSISVALSSVRTTNQPHTIIDSEREMEMEAVVWVLIYVFATIIVSFLHTIVCTSQRTFGSAYRELTSSFSGEEIGACTLR